ncbi:MAG TPA: hypothetical protein VF765_02895 [Polyangiaceae bacterium]
MELEANGSNLASLRGNRHSLDASVEIEWLVTRRLGLRLEPTISRDGSVDAGVSYGASWKLVQDFAHDFHLQLELLGRVPTTDTEIVQPGDPDQPLALDLRAAWRAGPLTFRPGVGVGAFGEADHSPARASLAVLAPFEGTGRFGFWGFEVDADGGRESPAVVAFELVPHLEPLGIPLGIGFALPMVVDAPEDRPSFGFYLRVFYESAREIEFGSARELR